MKKLGIIGGLGPSTTAKLYLDLVNAYRKAKGRSPSLLISNVPMPLDLEDDIISKSRRVTEMRPYLLDCAQELADAGAQIIAIPCNTAHVFLPDIEEAHSDKTYVDLINENIKQLSRHKYKKIGLLASSESYSSGIFDIAFHQLGLEIIKPNIGQRNILSDIILGVLNDRRSDASADALYKIINDLVDDGAECILLGCTDLTNLIDYDSLQIPVFDSYKIFLDSCLILLLQDWQKTNR